MKLGTLSPADNRVKLRYPLITLAKSYKASILKQSETIPAVLQIVPSLEAGGAERATIDIARALAKAGIRALIASKGGRLERELEVAGGELIRMPADSKNPFTVLTNAGKIADIVSKRNISLIHARSRAPAWSALIAARRAGIPLVTTYHGIYRDVGALKRFYNSVMVRGEAVIANSEWTAAHIYKTYPKKMTRVVVIPRGVDVNAFNPAAVAPDRVLGLRAEWGVTPHERVLLLPGRITRRKGHLLLLQALSLLRRDGRLPQDVRAVMAGDAREHTVYYSELAGAICQLNLTKFALLAPHISDMPAAYLAAEIVVSPSTRPESFGRVVPEAAAMGRPAIVSDHGGVRETMLSGESGVLIKPNDPVALADALDDFLARPPSQLVAMGVMGRRHVMAHYALERMCTSTLDLYQKLISA